MTNDREESQYTREMGERYLLLWLQGRKISLLWKKEWRGEMMTIGKENFYFVRKRKSPQT